MSSRTVIPPRPARATRVSATEGAAGREVEDPPPAAPANGDKGDGLPAKIAKYVPAETLAFFIPVAAALGTTRDGILVMAILVGAIGSVGYLWLAARNLAEDEKPLVHFYVLSVLAFGCWAVGTSASVMHLIGVDEIVGGVILGFAVFLIPLADGVANEVFKKKA